MKNDCPPKTILRPTQSSVPRSVRRRRHTSHHAIYLVRTVAGWRSNLGVTSTSTFSFPFNNFGMSVTFWNAALCCVCNCETCNRSFTPFMAFNFSQRSVRWNETRYARQLLTWEYQLCIKAPLQAGWRTPTYRGQIGELAWFRCAMQSFIVVQGRGCVSSEILNPSNNKER